MLSKSMRVVDEETRNQVCTAAAESDVPKVFFLLFIRECWCCLFSMVGNARLICLCVVRPLPFVSREQQREDQHCRDAVTR